jgi:ABC-type Zn uptake system ZnuABC Zn-binding protein ZnuA
LVISDSGFFLSVFIENEFHYQKEKLMFTRKAIAVFIIASVLLAACGGVPAADDGMLNVVASTTIIGDVVDQIGGDKISLTVLLPVDADPHSFEPAPRDVAASEEADLVFINGLGLEESLEDLLESSAGDVLVELSAGIETLEFGHEHEGDDHHGEGEDHEGEDHAEEGEDHEHEGEDHEEEGEDHEHEGEDHEEEGEEHAHDHAGADPHVWMDPRNVIVWADTIAEALSQADPDNADFYRANAAAYTAELQELHSWIISQLEAIPLDHRLMVTDHHAFGYFAAAYQFEVVGTIISGYSTLAEPSAQELAALEDEIMAFNVPAIFVGTTVNPALAAQVAEDTGVQLVPLYTGSLSAADGPAPTYIEMMRYDLNAIVEALR